MPRIKLINQRFPSNNIGNINIVLKCLDKIRYKHGAELLGIDSEKAIQAIGDTRNELTHYIYKEHSFGSYIADPNVDTDTTINLYVFYVLELALRTAILETIGFQVTKEVKDYLLDENLNWIRIQKDIDEDCQISQNRIKQILKPNDKRKSNFTYKRIYTTKWYDVSDDEDIEGVVDKAVRAAVEDILDMEKKALSQLN